MVAIWTACAMAVADTTPTSRSPSVTATRGLRIDSAAAAAVAGAAGWHTDDGSEFLDNYLRVTRRAKAVVLKVFGG